MDLNTIGEFGLIDLISLPHPKPELVIVGIGDDCAVLPYHAQQHQLISCDLMVEDVHFIRGNITPYQLGYKLVAVNLSDIAAMGGTPLWALLTVAWNNNLNGTTPDTAIAKLNNDVADWDSNIKNSARLITANEIYQIIKCYICAL